MNDIQTSRTISASSLNIVHHKEGLLVTRLGGNDTGYRDIQTGVIGAPLFFCMVKRPNSSPALSFILPHFIYAIAGTDSGKIMGEVKAAYDATNGCVRLYVTATSLHPSFATDETWEFSFTLMASSL